LPPVGAITIGISTLCPNGLVDKSLVEASTTVRGFNREFWKTLRLRRMVVSSSAPPSRYSKQKFGSLALANSRKSSIVLALFRQDGLHRPGLTLLTYPHIVCSTTIDKGVTRGEMNLHGYGGNGGSVS
jgi:hypothetical protein